MEILFVEQFSLLGGAQLCLMDVLDAVQRRKWHAHIALPAGGPLVERIRSRGLDVDIIPCGPYRSGVKTFSDFFQLPVDVWRQRRILADLINSGKFDLVYVNGPRLLPAAALAARDRVPVLFHAHNRLHQRSAAGLAGWSIRQADATVIACSNYVAQPLTRYVPKSKLHVISNGTSDLGFRPRVFGQGRSWRIGHVGRVSPEKGQAEFLEAVALLASEFPVARFMICGAPMTPVDKYLDRVSQLARGLPVEFLGWRDDIASVLADLDLLVVPSKDEGMPRVVLEAFSAGVPVVAFRAGGISELISDGENGFLVTEAASGALADRIREISRSDPETLRRVVENARRAWERAYTVAAYQSQIMDLVEQVGLAWPAKHEKAAPPAHK